MVMRDEDALRLTTKWAGTSSLVALPEDVGLTRTLGWIAAYFQEGSGRHPEGELFNQLFRELSGLAVEINAHGGILVWNTDLSYEHPALVVGSDDEVYISVQDSQGEDPTTDASDTYWTLLVVSAGLNQSQVDARIAEWAREGNTDDIPASKLDNAPDPPDATFRSFIQTWARVGDTTEIPRAKLQDEVRVIRSGTADPDDTVGADGDLYLQRS